MASKSAAKERRGKKWDAEFITCKKHPGRRSSRSAYVTDRVAYCRSCRSRKADGTLKRHVANQPVRSSLKNRAKYGAGPQSMSVLQIAERIIGIAVSVPRRQR